MSNTVLTLNASYEPLRPMSIQRALRLVLQDKAEIVEADGEIRTGHGKMPKPSVIRLKRLVKIPKRLRRKVTNTFLFARDSYKCQYCGKNAKELGQRSGLTRDHVVPLSRGGTNTWENCTTACSSCNWEKADRPLGQARHKELRHGEWVEGKLMKLLSTPTEPHLVNLVWSVRKLTPMQRKYVEMFYGANAVRALSKD
jgi:5-methylcytosine-specific restriction endonuclease McrA